MGPCVAVVGSATGAVFETYLERVLTPELRPGQVVVMDNLSAHKGERVRELIEQRGCGVLYLPPYSPDFNPIEEAFRQGQRTATQSRGSNSPGAGGGYGCGTLGGQRAGRTEFLRPLRLPSTRSTTMTTAVGNVLSPIGRCPSEGPVTVSVRSQL